MSHLRLAILQLLGNTLPIVFIRYNPDFFWFNEEKQYIQQQERLQTIYNFITTFNTNKSFSIKYMYYDLDENSQLTILNDCEYANELKEFVI